MDIDYLVSFVYECAFFFGVFGLFLAFALFQGRQSLMNIIVGLYLALLIFIEFKNYDLLFSGLHSAQAIALGKLVWFGLLTLLTTRLCFRIMPREFREERLESFPQKIILAIGATILVMIFSFHILPVTEFIDPGTPLQALFAPGNYFFWWLLVPLVILYIV